MLSRYSNIEYVLALPTKQGVKLIAKAIEERRREKVYMQYLAELPAIAKNGYTFEKYYAEVTRVVVKDTRPTDVLLDEIMSMKFD